MASMPPAARKFRIQVARTEWEARFAEAGDENLWTLARPRKVDIGGIAQALEGRRQPPRKQRGDRRPARDYRLDG